MNGDEDNGKRILVIIIVAEIILFGLSIAIWSFLYWSYALLFFLVGQGLIIYSIKIISKNNE